MNSSMKWLSLILIFLNTASAADFCVTGVRGTLTGNFTFKIEKRTNGDRMLSVLDQNRSLVFTSRATNRFTKFNSTGYGVCSVIAQGTDETSGAKYHVEVKVSPHFEKPCSAVVVPTNVEYVTLKVTPKGTTLGDDLTAYALSIIRCP